MTRLHGPARFVAVEQRMWDWNDPPEIHDMLKRVWPTGCFAIMDQDQPDVDSQGHEVLHAHVVGFAGSREDADRITHALEVTYAASEDDS